MITPLVSVIIPTYNRGDRLGNTLNSILDQSYKNIEIIIVDDGSNDNTHSLVYEYIKANVSSTNIIYLYQENSGAPVARNLGLSSSRGEYVVFFDSDDIMDCDRVYKQVYSLKNYNNAISACGFRYSDDVRNYYVPPKTLVDPMKSFLTHDLLGSTQSWMFTRDILVEVNGYDNDLICFQDVDLIFRILCKRPNVVTLQECLSTFINEGGNRVSQKGRTVKGLHSMLLSHEKRINFFAKESYIDYLQLEIRQVFQMINLIILYGKPEIFDRILKRIFKVILNNRMYVFCCISLYLAIMEVLKGFVKKIYSR